MFLHQQRIDYTKRAYKSLDKSGENQVGKQLTTNKIRIIIDYIFHMSNLFSK